jgi:probable phosphoglycerate mutase
MPLEITLVRHARSEANEANVWQGQLNSPLSAEGRRQAASLGERLRRSEFDLVVSSDLDRTRETAGAVTGRPELDPAWREMDLGEWENRSFDDVAEERPDLLEAIRRGDAVKFGETGETIEEFERRVVAAFDRLVERMDGSGRALVVTHGGVIDILAGRALGRTAGRRTFPIVTNTSLTGFSTTALWRDPDAVRIQTFNDASHLGHDAGFLGRVRGDGTPVLGLVRHAVTTANKEHRIQGRSCWGLDDEGRSQAARLAGWYGPVDRVMSSPTPRAYETAQAISNGSGIERHDDLMEMGFGDWEGQVYEDLIHRSTDELARRVFVDGDDLPRGRTGESFAMLVERMGGFLAALEVDGRSRTVAVSHGAAIKAAVAWVLGRGFDINDGISTPHNASVSHVVFGETGPVLADFSVAPPGLATP